jgi:hypothetical protein
LWLFAYYGLGASIAALLVMTGRTVRWAPALLAAPTMYLVFVSYRLQVNKCIPQNMSRPAAA